MKANSDVTEALRRTINLMQGELERSVLSTQMLGSLVPELSVHLEPNLAITRRLDRHPPIYVEYLRCTRQHPRDLKTTRNRP